MESENYNNREIIFWKKSKISILKAKISWFWFLTFIFVVVKCRDLENRKWKWKCDCEFLDESILS